MVEESIDRRPRFPKMGFSLFAPGKEKPGKPTGRSQVKLGNRNVDIQTPATRYPGGRQSQ